MVITVTKAPQDNLQVAYLLFNLCLFQDASHLKLIAQLSHDDRPLLRESQATALKLKLKLKVLFFVPTSNTIICFKTPLTEFKDKRKLCC
jgi:hypothetical protein